MHVRPVRLDDFDEWLRMRMVLWPQATEIHRAEQREWYDLPDRLALVASRPDGAGLAGLGGVGTPPAVDGGAASPVAYLEVWYVEPGARRQGVGAALVRAAEVWARENGYREFA